MTPVSGKEYKGVVKFMNYIKGFGFIVVDGFESEVFAHETNLLSRIEKGDAVTFEAKVTQKGTHALKVKKS